MSPKHDRIGGFTLRCSCVLCKSCNNCVTMPSQYGSIFSSSARHKSPTTPTRRHVLLEPGAAGVRQRADAQHRLLVHRRGPRADDAQEALHDVVRVRQHELRRRGVAVGGQLLDDRLQRPAEQPLNLAELLRRFGGHPGLRHLIERHPELLHHHRDELLHERVRVARRRADDLVQALVRLDPERLLRVRALARRDERLDDALEIRRERGAHGVVVVLAGAAREQPLQRPAALPRDVHAVRRGHHRRDVIRHLSDVLKDAADGPRRRVPDVSHLVLHRVQEKRQRLRRDRRELVRVRALQDGPERVRRRLSQAPLPLRDVLLDERHHVIHDGVLHARRDEAQARPARHGDVPRVVPVVHLVLVLFRQRLQKHRHEHRERFFDEAVVRHRRRRLRGVRVVNLLLTVNLFLADRGPELDRLQRDRLVVALGRFDG
eukprot:31408-Pelagococcus_subviridis.AAC.12